MLACYAAARIQGHTRTPESCMPGKGVITVLPSPNKCHCSGFMYLRIVAHGSFRVSNLCIISSLLMNKTRKKADKKAKVRVAERGQAAWLSHLP